MSRYRIRTIIDVRSRTEYIQQGKIYDAKVRNIVGTLQSEVAVAPMQIPDIQYHEIDLNGSSYERTLLRRLRYTSLAKLIALMTMGRRTEAISVLGKEVIQPRGLVGQARDSINSSGHESKQVFKILADAESHPVFFHCTSGKDRTGLVALLLLLILEIPLNVVSADYMASEGQLTSERELRLRELKAMGLSDDFADYPPNWVNDVHEHIRKIYGSIHGYLELIGVDQALRCKIRSNIFKNTEAKSSEVCVYKGFYNCRPYIHTL
ncbi:MAG: hypothetical protein Q9184_000129 [Pyrenodesmia sp. 2 TL-2023]